MKAKIYLSKIEIIERRIKRNNERIAYLRALADGMKGVRYDTDPVQTSPSDMMSLRIGEIVDLERLNADETVRLEKVKEEIISKIEMIDDADAEDVLFYHWVEHRSFQAIAEMIPCSLRNVHYIHGRGLAKLTEVLNR